MKKLFILAFVAIVLVSAPFAVRATDDPVDLSDMKISDMSVSQLATYFRAHSPILDGLLTALGIAPACQEIFVRDLDRGSRDNARRQDVAALQRILIDGGYLTMAAPDGIYGKTTKEAVKLFQIANGIRATGTFGPLTRKVANEMNCAVRIDTIAPVVRSLTSNPASPLAADLVGTEIVFTASANDNAGVSRVEFFDKDNGNALLYSTTTSPFTYATNTPASTFTVTAIAYDAAGNQSRPKDLRVVVQAATGQTCTEFTYTTWSACTAGTQNREIATRVPANCTGGTPEPLTQTCTTDPASVTLTSPNGGESWVAGSVHNITWQSSGLPSGSNLALSLVDTATSTITSSVLASLGTYAWTIPSATVGSHFKVFALYHPTTGADVSDYTDSDFTVTAPGANTCTEFTYTTWSACTAGTQNREIATRVPANCTGGTPEPLTQTCTGTSAVNKPVFTSVVQLTRDNFRAYGTDIIGSTVKVGDTVVTVTGSAGMLDSNGQASEWIEFTRHMSTGSHNIRATNSVGTGASFRFMVTNMPGSSRVSDSNMASVVQLLLNLLNSR